MSEFCQECSVRVLGYDARDLAGLVTEAEHRDLGLVAVALCEGCGPIFVDHEGRRVRDPEDEAPDYSKITRDVSG